MHPLIDKICQEQVAFDEIVASWSGLDLGLLRELSATEQDSEWHAEGDVGTHTGMVLAETYRELAESAADLDESRKRILLLSAIFHDIAKPLVTTRRTIKGRERVTSSRHAERGRSWLAYRLGHLGLPASEIAGILGLVGYHHHPRRLVTNDEPHPHWRRVAREADVRLLYHLECADLRGRWCQDLAEQLEIIELFRAECEMLGLWENKNLWSEWEHELDSELTTLTEPERSRAISLVISEGEQGRAHSPWNAWMRSHDTRHSDKTFTLLVGVSGSGKSTWVGQQPDDTTVIRLDDIRAEMTGDVSNQKHNGRVAQLAKERLRAALRQRGNVIWDGTNLREDRRRSLLNIAEDYGAFTRIVVFQTTTETLHQRNRVRDKPIPMDVLERQIERMQWPTRVEAHELVVVSN
ncbi:MAG: AAA family ATPase [Chloroflexota bacterium]